MANRTVSLTPGKRVLFLTKDFELIRRQLAGELDRVKPRVVEVMESAVRLEVPLKVDAGVGRSWYDAK